MASVAVIDNSRDTLELFEFVLRGEHDVRTFDDGEAFLQEFHRGAFGLIMLDLVLPGMTGFEIFNKVREEDPDVPVVAVTAKALPPEKESALAAGFCDYFVKPIFDIEGFRQTIYGHVGRCAKEPTQK